MITDESIGLSVPENEEERYWNDVIKNTEQDLDRLEKLIKFQKAILEMAREKLANATKK